LVGIVSRQRTLRSRFVKSAQAEEDGKRILDNLIVALIGLAQVLTAGAADQILIERQVDLTHCHCPYRIPLGSTTARDDPVSGVP
jgi:hypothetical protein